MSERLIVVEHCRDCPGSTFGFLRGRTRICAMMLPEEHICPDAGTPDWCPLPKLPGYSPFEDERHLGWNACIDAILGEEEE